MLMYETFSIARHSVYDEKNYKMYLFSLLFAWDFSYTDKMHTNSLKTHSFEWIPPY